jgi:hypothetical protein
MRSEGRGNHIALLRPRIREESTFLVMSVTPLAHGGITVSHVCALKLFPVIAPCQYPLLSPSAPPECHSSYVPITFGAREKRTSRTEWKGCPERKNNEVFCPTSIRIGQRQLLCFLQKTGIPEFSGRKVP